MCVVEEWEIGAGGGRKLMHFTIVDNSISIVE